MERFILITVDENGVEFSPIPIFAEDLLEAKSKSVQFLGDGIFFKRIFSCSGTFIRSTG